jgi:hypothetical protein
MKPGYVSHSPDKAPLAPGERPMTYGNDASPGADTLPQLNVLAHYTKDLSFENPNAPSSLTPQPTPPQINIQINVNANNIAENDYTMKWRFPIGGEQRQGDVLVRRARRWLPTADAGSSRFCRPVPAEHGTAGRSEPTSGRA